MDQMPSPSNKKKRVDRGRKREIIEIVKCVLLPTNFSMGLFTRVCSQAFKSLITEKILQLKVQFQDIFWHMLFEHNTNTI